MNEPSSQGRYFMARHLMAAAAILLAAGVLLGAFAAHGLKDRLDAGMLSVFRTAVDYHIWHSLGLLLIGTLMDVSGRKFLWPAMLLLLGILLFSGSLYLLVLTGFGWLGMITPVGGLAFIAGWFWLAVQLLRQPGERR